MASTRTTALRRGSNSPFAAYSSLPMMISLSDSSGESMACSTVNARNRRIFPAVANDLLASSLPSSARISSGDYVRIVMEFYSTVFFW